MNNKKKDDWSNVVLVNLACLVAGFIISIILDWKLLCLILTLFITSMTNYAFGLRSSKDYLVWDRIGLSCLIASFLVMFFGFLKLLSYLH